VQRAALIPPLNSYGVIGLPPPLRVFSAVFFYKSSPLFAYTLVCMNSTSVTVLKLPRHLLLALLQAPYVFRQPSVKTPFVPAGFICLSPCFAIFVLVTCTEGASLSVSLYVSCPITLGFVIIRRRRRALYAHLLRPRATRCGLADSSACLPPDDWLPPSRVPTTSYGELLSPSFMESPGTF